MLFKVRLCYAVATQHTYRDILLSITKGLLLSSSSSLRLAKQNTVVLAYWIMLLIMLYEGMFFIAIILGLGTGYFASLRMKRDTAQSFLNDVDTKNTDEEAAAVEARDPTCDCTSPCCENS